MSERRTMRVLVIDDNYDVAWLLTQLIKSCGHEAVFSVTQSDGIEQARTFRPDVIFLDLAMPGESGYALAPRLRQCDLPKVRIIAVSGYQDSVEIRQSAGIDEHAIKPVSLETLKRLLEPAATV